MAEVNFNLYITNEGIAQARQTLSNPGWYLIPYQFRISQNRGQINATRTYASIDSNPWYSEAFSGVTAGTTDNKLIHTVVVPPIISGQTSERTYGEIYFIYKNHNDEPFLYAIGAPTSSLVWTPGISQQFYFAFTLNNVDIAETFDINYTYPQDIANHNNSLDAHDFLLKRDGSRTATGILTYDSSNTFTQDNQIISKSYVDNYSANIDLSNLTSTGDNYFAHRNLDNVTDIAQVRVITETYKSGNSWYRIYDDKWCEQGGNNSGEVTFAKPFTDTTYCITTSAANVTAKSSISCRFSVNTDWVAVGYIL